MAEAEAEADMEAVTAAGATWAMGAMVVMAEAATAAIGAMGATWAVADAGDTMIIFIIMAELAIPTRTTIRRHRRFAL
jgi:hypothetical protein